MDGGRIEIITLRVRDLVRAGNLQIGRRTRGTISVGDGTDVVATVAYIADLTDSDAMWMRLSYVFGDSERWAVRDEVYRVVTTRPGFGGRRYWLESEGRRRSVWRIPVGAEAVEPLRR